MSPTILTPTISTWSTVLSFSGTTFRNRSTKIAQPLLFTFLVVWNPSVAATTLYPRSLSLSNFAFGIMHSCSTMARGLLPKQSPTSSINLCSWSFDVDIPVQLKDIARKSGFVCCVLDSKPARCQVSDICDCEIVGGSAAVGGCDSIGFSAWDSFDCSIGVSACDSFSLSSIEGSVC